MPVYRYEALSVGGEKATGVVDAESQRDAKTRLRQDNLHVTRLTTASFVQRRRSKLTHMRSYSRRRATTVEAVTRQLALLLENEVKLTDALNITMSEVTDKKILLVLRDIRDRVANGSSVADAMEPHQWLFGRMYISMVRVGETAGTLPGVLRRMATHLRGQVMRRGQVTTVLIYPTIMLCVAFGLSIFLTTYLFPKIREVIETTTSDLPLPTQILTVISDTIINYYPVILIVGGGVIVLLIMALRTERGRRVRDALLLRIPVVRDLIRKSETAQFTGTLQTLLGSGVKMADSMAVLLQITSNTFMKDTINDLQESIMRGSDVSTVLRRSRIFPRGVAHMVAVGEQSGELEQVLGTLSKDMNDEVELTVGRLNALIQPIIILFLALVVGFLVAAAMLPILQMGQLRGL